MGALDLRQFLLEHDFLENRFPLFQIKL